MRELVDSILTRHKKAPSSLIPVLQDLQDELRYLPEDCLTMVAHGLGISPATAYGVATFYAQFSLEPRGKYIIKVCDGTACHVRGSSPLYQAICKRVKLENGKATSKNGLFTVETVACLGACVIAPVVVINDKAYGQMTPEAINLIIDELEKEDGRDQVCKTAS
ncbi:MAG TPA: NAD(P)H-dependent oxidoreductase subunit E [Firmicutes bacterium]|nr:NAD(P)H-dependent oxidoreductase subunit E [Bacillota bacterium]